MTLRIAASALAIAASLALAPLPAPAQTAAPAWASAQGLRFDPSVRLGTLPNGMRYAIKTNATPPRNASLRLLIDTGSLNEKEDQRGLAHFIEHMVFNGSKDVPEGQFVQRLERHGLKFGADTNATTDFEHTTYKLDLPETDADTVDTSLFLLREVADKALFDAKALERERGVVLSEERTRAGPQLRVAIDEMNYLYKGQPLGQRIPIGLTKVIQTAPRERLKAFYDAYYRPERAMLVAVGDFDPDQMEARIKKQFGDWKGEGPAGATAGRGTVLKRGPEAQVYSEPGAPTRVSVAWVRPPDIDPDSRQDRLLHTIDGLAMEILNRRIERLAALGEKAPLIAGGAGRSQPADTADTVQILAVTRPGQWQKGLAAIDAEQRRLVQFGVAQSEIDREVGEHRAALQAAVAGTSTRASSSIAESIVASVGAKTLYLTPADQLALFDEAARLATPARILASARKLFAGSGPLLYLSSPAPVAGGPVALTAAYAEAEAAAVKPTLFAAAKPWPYASFGTPGAVVEQRELPGVGATAVRFANGVRLIVKPTAFARDEILVQTRIGDGKLAMSPTAVDPEWAIEAGAVALGGVGKLSYEELQQSLAGKVYGAGIAVNDDNFTLSGRTTPADLATQMQVLAAYTADPGWRSNGWDRFRALASTLQDQLSSSPSGVLGRDGPLLLHSGDKRWSTPTIDQMSVSNISQAKALLGPAFASAPIEIVMVGDVKVDEAIRAVRTSFGALPPRSRAHVRGPAPSFPAGGEVVLTHKGRPDQGLALIAWPTTGFYGNVRDARTLTVLSELFQLRLIAKVREEQGIAYSPNAAHAPSEVFDHYGLFTGGIEAPPAALPGFVATAQQIAADLRDTPVGADELERAKKPLLEGISRSRVANPYWLQNLAGAADDPRVLRKIDTQVADYQAVTPAMLQAAARTYLRPERAYRILVVPEKK